jgi:uracil-DNA glycosylase family 4
MHAQEPAKDCTLCPRLAAFRQNNIAAFPDWFNAPVPAWASEKPKLVIVGLAPGLRGANRTGRPFTGDYAGDLLYETMVKAGLAQGTYDARPDDGLELVDSMIVNAVRCVPPQNKPIGAEIAACRQFLTGRIDAEPQAKVFIALGRIAHESFLTSYGLRKAAYPFGHGARHAFDDGRVLYDSYHCSRYNTNTGRLTTEMFEQVVFAAAKEALAG